MQILFGPYPMTIAQMSAWAKDCTLSPEQCSKALHTLNGTICIKLRKDT